MSENRIRKTNSVQPAGPQSAGVWFNADDNAPRYNPDGTTRYLSPVTFGFTASAAADAVDRDVWIAPVALELIGVNASWKTASTSGTFNVEKCTGTTAPGSGTELLSAAIDTATTANTVNAGTLIATQASKRFAAGDRLALDFSGTVTNLVGLVVTFLFKQV